MQTRTVERSDTGLVRTVEWLLEPNNPSIRFLTLTQLQGRDSSSQEVGETRKKITIRGWVHDLLAKQIDGSYWVYPKSCYHPKHTGTVWVLQLLAVLGMGESDVRIRTSCERFLGQHRMPDGGFACGMHSTRFSEECLTGRMTAVLLQFGYSSDDQRIRNALDWLITHQLEDGGWNCRHGPNVQHSSIYSTYLALWAFSKLTPQQRTSKIRKTIRHGVEFMLAHRLYKSHRTREIIKRDYARFQFPPNIRYDALQALKLMIDLGASSD